MSEFLAVIQTFGDMLAFGTALAELAKTIIERIVRPDDRRDEAPDE